MILHIYNISTYKFVQIQLSTLPTSDFTRITPWVVSRILQAKNLIWKHQFIRFCHKARLPNGRREAV